MKDYILVNTRQDYIYGEDPVYVYESNFELDTESIVTEARRQAIKDKIDMSAEIRITDEFARHQNGIADIKFDTKLADTVTFDTAINKACMDMMRESIKREEEKKMRNCMIDNVIFNPPATIVFWKDGTKTVVKCQDGDIFDPEKGITMAFFKKLHGNTGAYNNILKKWTKDYQQDETIFELEFDDVVLASLLRRIELGASKKSETESDEK